MIEGTKNKNCNCGKEERKGRRMMEGMEGRI
jgi:hypothetical protein